MIFKLTHLIYGNCLAFFFAISVMHYLNSESAIVNIFITFTQATYYPDKIEHSMSLTGCDIWKNIRQFPNLMEVEI